MKSTLYPIDTESREVKSLDGLWDFKADPLDLGSKEHWENAPLPGSMPMPVPASYNDLTTDPALRDLVGNVWYQRSVLIPSSWADQHVSIRFGSVTHHATVWLNGRRIAEHKGGYLPFEAIVSDAANFGGPNLLTVKVDNRLDWTTLPPGQLTTVPDTSRPDGTRQQQSYHFDFFNYAGIHRPVYLVRKPPQHVLDITTQTDLQGDLGVVNYAVAASQDATKITATLTAEDGQEVASAVGLAGRLEVPGVTPWQPGNAYLYELVVTAEFGEGPADVYRLPVGVRTVKVEGDRFLINGEPFYFRGFGKHEDADLRGRGLDHATNIRDFNLMKWIGANSFRTSHYPYSEELMQLADRQGVVVIDEVPAVGMFIFGGSDAGDIFCDERVNDQTLAHHLDVVKDLIARDKNHPCVVMWSLANEASTGEDAALPYFTKVADCARSADPTRPITIVGFQPAHVTKVDQLFDVICLNKYNAWYESPGELDTIGPGLEATLRSFHETFGKPMIMAEFGADTIAGFHSEPATMFSEEYQVELLERTMQVFDKLDFVIGEHVWNFADFGTKQGVNRVMGNRKGVFTRQRQPKMAAHMLRKRWTEQGPTRS